MVAVEVGVVVHLLELANRVGMVGVGAAVGVMGAVAVAAVVEECGMMPAVASQSTWNNKEGKS